MPDNFKIFIYLKQFGIIFQMVIHNQRLIFEKYIFLPICNKDYLFSFEDYKVTDFVLQLIVIITNKNWLINYFKSLIKIKKDLSKYNYFYNLWKLSLRFF